MIRKETLVKGFLDLALLKILEKDDLHGYHIVKRLEEHESGALKSGEGTIYPLLSRLEKQGWLTSRWEQQRKIYSITRKGRAELSQKADDWRSFSRALTSLMRGAPA